MSNKQTPSHRRPTHATSSPLSVSATTATSSSGDQQHPTPTGVRVRPPLPFPSLPFLLREIEHPNPNVWYLYSDFTMILPYSASIFFLCEKKIIQTASGKEEYFLRDSILLDSLHLMICSAARHRDQIGLRPSTRPLVCSLF